MNGWGENRSATGGLLYLFNGEKSAGLNGQICRCRRSEGGCKRPGPQQCVIPEYPTIERTRCACESEAKQGEPRREESRAMIEIPARMGRHGGLDTLGVRSSARPSEPSICLLSPATAGERTPQATAASQEKKLQETKSVSRLRLQLSGSRVPKVSKWDFQGEARRVNGTSRASGIGVMTA